MEKQLQLKKNDELIVTFEDLTHDGAAVAKVDGYPIFVPQGLTNEKALIRIVKLNKGYGFGKLIEIIEASPQRVEAPCPIYRQCGGCQLQHLSYEGQLEAKHKQVSDVMKRIGKLENVVIHPVIGMDNPWHYRNKGQIPVGENDGKLIGGFYANRSHRIIEMEHCLIQNEVNNELVNKVIEIANRFDVKAYNEETHKGILRHVMVRVGKVTNEKMIVLVTRTKDFPNKEKIVQTILEEIPEVDSLVQNINSKKTNVIFGDETITLAKSPVIYDYIGDIKFAISARSFYQVNPEQTKVLYTKALEYAQLTGEESVIDAYCGIGTISLFLAQKAKSVFGVEIVPEAIEDAKNNAVLNGITNAQFEVGAAEEVITNWYKAGNTADVLVVDPPRKGCDESLLNTIIEMKPKRVVYVSCNAATLARDLRILEDGGYQTKEIQPVDMFPHTTHVECVSQLILKEDN